MLTRGVALTADATFKGLTQTLPAVKGSYQVNADCTFTSKLDNGATFFASIVDGGQELFVLQTTPGVIASGVGSPQSGQRGNDDDSGRTACGRGHSRLLAERPL